MDREERTVPVVRRLRRARFDVAVLFPNSIRSAWIAWLADIPRRVGYRAPRARPAADSDRLHYPRDAAGRRLPTPIVESYLKLARRLGCPVDSVRTELATTGDDEAAADRRLVGAWPGLRQESRVPQHRRRIWPRQELAQHAFRRAGAATCRARPAWPCWFFAGRMNVLRRGRSCVAACHPQVVSLADRSLGIGLTKACVRRSALLITTDSGPRHFAAAFNTPVITLFGPTHVSWTRTYHPRAWHVFHPVPCGPCQRPVCPEGHHRCMRELTPESRLPGGPARSRGIANETPSLVTSVE